MSSAVLDLVNAGVTRVVMPRTEAHTPCADGEGDEQPNALSKAVQQAIVDLSVHPAGCKDWRFYEQLCLDVADRLNTAYKEHP